MSCSQPQMIVPEHLLGQKWRSLRISAEKTCLIALVYIGTQSSMYAIADKVEVAESSVHAYVYRFVRFLHSVSDHMMRMPDSAERTRIRTGFLAKS
ncbi:hypothetical protein HPB48_022190 [Haemaphysalis longicornis]|uniref:Uncharacterized protein n=1 Tax=Haemaphysalis longicornis TaxID=44386 RepID=A0A9J6GJT4_HAELO|nr:hypothetical protein HPB48_022190 [Haemaphysalis longicornis]